jgi:hypothetical protein
MFTNLWSLFQAESSQPTFKPLTFPNLQAVKTGEDMEKHKGKIVVYETTSSYLDDEGAALVGPEGKVLKAAIVSNQPYRWDSTWDSVESGFALQQLRVTGARGHNQALVTSRLQNANFQARLPYPKELEKIKELVANKQAEFPSPWGPDYKGEIDDVMRLIDTQQSETKKPVTLRKLAR